MEVLQLNLLEQKIKILNILKLEILRNKWHYFCKNSQNFQVVLYNNSYNKRKILDQCIQAS